MLACHGHQQEWIGPIDSFETDADAVPPRLVAWRLMRAVGDVHIGTNRLENALAILPNKYASPEGAQLGFLLMHAHAPTTTVQCDRCGQPSESCSGNFCMHQWTDLE